MIYISKSHFFSSQQTAVQLRNDLKVALGEKAIVRLTNRKSNGLYPHQVKCTLLDEFQTQENSDLMENTFHTHTFQL